MDDITLTHRQQGAKRIQILFTDVFGVAPEALGEYGAFDISLLADLPVFIDPFLLFNSDKPEYRQLHDEVIRYLTFLRDKSVAGGVTEGDLKAWYYFGEVKETWMGFSALGNRGQGLGPEFARALNTNFHRLFSEDAAHITRGRHLEKLCLIRERVGKDNISDFTTNLIKGFLATYTARFAEVHIAREHLREFSVPRSRFSYETETWVTERFILPAFDGSFVLLVPKDILTRDDTWINKDDLLNDFEYLPAAIENEALRAQVSNYFRMILPSSPSEKQRREAAARTVAEFPQLIDYYIKRKEETGDRAQRLSDERVRGAEYLYQGNFVELARMLDELTDFYRTEGNSLEAALARVHYLKQVIEHNDGYRLFYDGKGRPIQREADLQIAYRFTWFGSPLDVNREVNNGRGPVDYKVSKGRANQVLVEFKLASNSQLRRNLENQVKVYEAANETKNSIKVILYFSAEELWKVRGYLRELGLSDSPYVVLIDARRDNKQSASRV